MDENRQKIEELIAIVEAVKDRVRAQYPEPANHANPIAVPDLLPIVHARDAAQAKMASIGGVNPRRGGPVNGLIQTTKRMIARSLGWFVRDQVTFNREMIGCVEAILESMNDANRTFLAIAGQVREFSARIDEIKELGAATSVDIRKWQTNWERRLTDNETQFFRGVSDFQSRSTMVEKNVHGQIETLRASGKAMHEDFRRELERGTGEIQKKLWADLEKVRLEFERLIHNELRVLRQRAGVAVPSASATPEVSVGKESAKPAFDYQRFADRFRGSEEYVRGKLQFYVPYFAGRREVLDIGCGRGEFLEMVAGRGIDLSEESVAHCRAKGLRAEVADLFPYLSGLARGALDGIFSSQVIEHLPPERIPEMIRLCASSLTAGGILALETPNPDCLAIFATHFYLDPTHTRPVPSSLLAFYLEEAGMGGIEVHPLSPAIESFPEIGELPEAFRKRFFGGLDYAILAKKL